MWRCVLFVFTSTLFFSVYLATTITDTARAREEETRDLKENLEEKVLELEAARKEVLFERNKLKSIIECMHEGVVFVDERNQIALSNKAAQQIQQEQFNADLSRGLRRASPRTQNRKCLRTLTTYYHRWCEIYRITVGRIEQKSVQIKDRHFENTVAAVRDTGGGTFGHGAGFSGCDRSKTDGATINLF